MPQIDINYGLDTMTEPLLSFHNMYESAKPIWSLIHSVKYICMMENVTIQDLV